MNESEIGTTQMRQESSGEPSEATDGAAAEPGSTDGAAQGGDGERIGRRSWMRCGTSSTRSWASTSSTWGSCTTS